MKSVCAVCGAEFIEPVGFIEPHYHPCACLRYGLLFTIDAPEATRILLDIQWVPDGEIERARKAAQKAAELGLL